MKYKLLPSLYVDDTRHRGRGVFAKASIPANTIIETSPVIVLSPKERKQIEGTILYHYIFEWGTTKRKACMALGLLSLYNHSFDPNCEYEMDYDEMTMTVKTIKPVKKGEELFFSYNGDPKDQTPLWFETT